MKNLQLYEQKDITKLKNEVGYFFEGEGGLLNRNKLPMYDLYYETDDRLVSFGKLIECVSPDENRKLRIFVCEEIDRMREEIEKAELNIKNLRNSIIKKQDLLKQTENCTTIKETVDTILNLTV